MMLRDARDRVMDSRVGRVIVSWETLWAVLAGVAVWFSLDQSAAGVRAVALGAAAGAVAIVAVLATVVTLVSVLYDSSAFVALIERLGGRDAAMFPYWFHGYVAASAVALGLIAAAAAGSAMTVSRVAATAACAGLVWAGFAMIGLTRQAMRQSDWKRRLEDAKDQARRRNAG